MIKNVSVILGDIMVQDTEAVVCFISPDLEWKGSLNQKIMQMAGPEFDDYVLDHVSAPKAGQVYAIPGFNLPYKSVLLCVNPVWEDALQQEDRELAYCYRGIIDTLVDEGIESVSIPAMGKGQRRFPHARAARVSMRVLREYMDTRIRDLRIVCYDQVIFDVYQDRYNRF